MTRSYNRGVDAPERHLRLLTETIEAVNSTLHLQEVLELIARKVADALGTDACFVYLYDGRIDSYSSSGRFGNALKRASRCA